MSKLPRDTPGAVRTCDEVKRVSFDKRCSPAARAESETLCRSHHLGEAMARTVTLLAVTKFLLVALALAWWSLASVLGQADREEGFPSNPQ